MADLGLDYTMEAFRKTYNKITNKVKITEHMPLSQPELLLMQSHNG